MTKLKLVKPGIELPEPVQKIDVAHPDGPGYGTIKITLRMVDERQSHSYIDEHKRTWAALKDALFFAAFIVLFLILSNVSLAADCGGQPATQQGAPMADLINGTNSEDSIVGLQGGDYIRGFQADDDLCGNDGADVLMGGQGTNHLNGSRGNDVLVGGVGTDIEFADQGSDVLLGNAGNDIMSGGPGPDLIYCGAGNDAVDVSREPDGSHDLFVNCERSFLRQ